MLQMANVTGAKVEEEAEFDYVFVATGYVRHAHEEILAGVKGLLPAGEAKFEVQRDYRVKFAEGKVGAEAGVWLQGCNEGTHGVSAFFSLRIELEVITNRPLAERYPPFHRGDSERGISPKYFRAWLGFQRTRHSGLRISEECCLESAAM